MIPLIFNLGPTELIIILVIILLLFGGSRLAGLGKSTGRALKEFKEETKDLRGADKTQPPAASTLPPATPPLVGPDPGTPTPGTYEQPPAGNVAQPTDARPTEGDVRKDA